MCPSKKYDCIYATAACLWFPEVLPKIFKRLCLFLSVYNSTNSSTAAFTKNGKLNLSNNSTEAKTVLLFWFT